MMDFLQKLINEYKNTFSTTVKVIVDDEEREEEALYSLKSAGYISFYSYKFLSDNDYWECLLTKKAIDKYAPNFSPSIAYKQVKIHNTHGTQKNRKGIGWLIAIVIILILALIGSSDIGSGSNSRKGECAVCGGSGLVNTGFIDFKTCPVCKGSGVDFH